MSPSFHKIKLTIKKNNDQKMSSQHFASTLYIAFESVAIILYSVNDVLTAFNK